MENLKEEWVSVKSFDGYYEVSDLGRVKSLAREWSVGKKGDTLIKPGRIPQGNSYRLFVIFCVDKVKTRMYVHRLVADHFCEKKEGCDVVNHLNSDPSDNRAVNLEWTTQKGNVIHAFETGFREAKKGEEHYKAKLKDADIPKIKELVRKGKRHWEIAEIYGVNRNTITRVISGARWKHVN